MKKINWGVIGLGNIAQRFSESFLEVQNSNLLAIASKDSLKLEQNKKKFNTRNQGSLALHLTKEINSKHKGTKA